ncbi:hypothetical protein FE257_009262 [Aspergillus nanangensis]|uniref:Xylanolytic transcriptional activator regulatory domain-containing protein n=1 Tax=Aspergillus nanangensis TaxID=2582783 RepID=A0AAD4CKB3_ASPNN|nr:hypothetical protein FE257_009262 [Aspergillus nanangensis]
MDDYAHVPKISDQKAVELYEHVARLSSGANTPYMVDLAFLKDKAAFNMFIQLYFEHFHPSLPLLHKVTFCPLEMPWILNLAVATIGSHYSRLSSSYRYTTLLGDCLRLAVSELIDHDINVSIGIPFAQAILLSQVDTAYSGQRNLVLKAQFYRSFAVTICRGIAAGLRRREPPCKQTESRHETYHQWLQRELEKRIVYCGWLLDCQYSLHNDIPFIMTLDDIDLELPCNEETWDKPVNTEKMEEVLTQPVHLRDILAADARTERMYHMTSILLYLPFKRLCMSSGWMATETSTKSAQMELSTWLSRDGGQNARVAVRHAAILFALIRTHSTNTYHEAQSLLLSTLTIWVFATLQQHAEYGEHNNDAKSSIHLDRPMSLTDEEDWISGNAPFVPRIAGVGCIGGPLGARRLLIEACDILHRHECWGVNRRVVVVLEQLLVCGNALSSQ